MADHFYAINKGQGLDPSVIVTGAASSAASHIELRTLDGSGLTRMDVINGLQTLLQYMHENAQITP